MKRNVRTSNNLTMSILLVTMILFFSNNSYSQGRWSIELRPDVNFPTKELGKANLETGFGGEATIAYRFLQHLGVYAGWSWNHFGSDHQINGVNLDYEETGYTYGLQFIHPIGNSKFDFLLRAGGLANHIEVEQGDEIISDSGHGFGWQVEGGIAFRFGEKFSLMPSIRYRTLSRELTLESVKSSVDLNYLSAGLGIVFKF